MTPGDSTDSATGQESFLDRTVRVLEKLCSDAKQKDEFEYACSLLRVRGVEDRGWDPLEETQQLVADMFSLLQSPLRDDTRFRIALLTYCHLTEVDAIYAVIDNLLTTVEGERYRPSPFQGLYNQRRSTNPLTGSRPPSARRVIDHVKDHAKKLGAEELIEILILMFDDQVRNAFFHSDYTLYRDEFRSREAWFEKNNVRTHSMKIGELKELIERGLSFFDGFMAVYFRQINS